MSQLWSVSVFFYKVAQKQAFKLHFYWLLLNVFCDKRFAIFTTTWKMTPLFMHFACSTVAAHAELKSLNSNLENNNFMINEWA